MRIYVNRGSHTAPLDVDGQVLGRQLLEQACEAFGVSTTGDVSLWRSDSPVEIDLSTSLEDQGVKEGDEIGLVSNALRFFSLSDLLEE